MIPDLIAWLGALTSHGPTAFGSRPAPGFTALLYIAALGIPALLWMRHWLALLLWPAAFLLAYGLLEVPFYHWYALPPLLAIVAAAAAAAEAVHAGLTRVLRRVLRPRNSASALPGTVAGTACVIALGLAVIPLGRFTLALGQDAPYPVERAYIALGQWLERETPPAASIGYVEIGIVGYYARRTVIDPLGLVNPGVAAHVARRDFLYAYRTHRPDVIVHNPIFFPDLLGVMLDQTWFQDEYERVTTLDSGQAEPVTIYWRR
jgi:hypothetical protein